MFFIQTKKMSITWLMLQAVITFSVRVLMHHLGHFGTQTENQLKGG